MKKTHKRTDKNTVILFAVCVALLGAMAVGIIWSLFTDLSSAAEQYADAMLQNDADAVYAMYAPQAVSYLLRETDMTEAALKTNLRTKMSRWTKAVLTDEIGEVSSSHAELVAKEDIPSETVKELEQNFDVNAQSVKKLTISYHAEGAKGAKDGEMTAYVVKIGGVWYLYDLQMLLE